MGSGYKNFGAEVLTSNDVDGYLMRQTLMTFADSSARNTALSGVLDEGMIAYLEGTDEVTYYTGSAWRTIYLPETTWTPTWTNLTVGNGTVTARYYRTGDMVHAVIQLAFGSTTSISGTVSSTLPVSPDTTVTYFAGSALFNDASSRRYNAGCLVNTSGTPSVTPTHSSGSTGLVTSTDPFTWTTSDEMNLFFSYPAA